MDLETTNDAPAHTNIPLSDILSEPERFADVLDGLEDKILRFDLVHPSEDNDCAYIFLIWCEPNQHDEVLAQIEANVERSNEQQRAIKDPRGGWVTEIIPKFSCGLTIVHSWY